MPAPEFVSSNAIRSWFAQAMSQMYRAEVPQYGTLVELVAEVNAGVLKANPDIEHRLSALGELGRIDLERHGAIRVGTAAELHTMRRLFAVMGMQPVGYYDLSVAGVPVHSTSFRPVDDDALKANPFRVFTSLLRLELIEDKALRAEAESILARRSIFTPRALALIELFERQGGLSQVEAQEFVKEAIETFRWHGEATVSAATYKRLSDAHRLIADVVSFKGPHINHLTPRTLDIDAVQRKMPERGITPKAVIEGPPRRACDILLRQTSFKALEEAISFVSSDGKAEGSHTARFGEIEQRGVALTAKGRALYDKLLSEVRQHVQVGSDGGAARDYGTELTHRFREFPDSWEDLFQQDLAFFQYSITAKGRDAAGSADVPRSVTELVSHGYLRIDPIVYEDFLPVSAAGIFQSNLGTDKQQNYASLSNRNAFEAAIGVPVQDELKLYAARQSSSLAAALDELKFGTPADAATG